MTIDNYHGSSTQIDDVNYWNATYTEKEATKQGLVSKDIYRSATLIARAVVEHHIAAGTPRSLWEPTLLHVEQVAGPYVDAGEQVLTEGLAADVDPVLDASQDSLEQATASIDAAERYPSPITVTEGGGTFPGTGAADFVDNADAKIDRDHRRGKNHHRRISKLWRRLAKLAPWLEALGLLAFLTWYFDVPLLNPWLDPLAFFLTTTIVAVLIAGQTKTVHLAGEKHNLAREAEADGNRHEAESLFKSRNFFLALAAVIALVITGGLVFRSIAALGDAGLAVTVLIISLALVAGLLMPVLVYFVTAFDGSRVARQSEAATADLNADVDDQDALKEQARSEIQSVLESHEYVTDKLCPQVVNEVQAEVDAVHPVYNFVRIQIGGLAVDPPTKVGRKVYQGEDGTLQGEISTGIPGTRTVNLLPMLDRLNRAEALKERAILLQQRLDAIPAHPWAKSSPK